MHRDKGRRMIMTWKVLKTGETYRSNNLYKVCTAHFLHFHHGNSIRSSSSTCRVVSGTGASITLRNTSIHFVKMSFVIRSSGKMYWNKDIMSKLSAKLSIYNVPMKLDNYLDEAIKTLQYLLLNKHRFHRLVSLEIHDQIVHHWKKQVHCFY